MKAFSILICSDESHRTVQSISLAKMIYAESGIVDFDIPSGASILIQPKGASDVPKYIIGAGDVAHKSVLREKENYKNARTIAILLPHENLDKFDYIFAPSYEPLPKLPNIIPTIGLLNDTNPSSLEQSVENYSDKDFLNKLQNLTSPKIAMLVGGKHIGGNVTIDDITPALEIAESKNASLMITTSHRTEEKLIDFLESYATANNHIFFNYRRNRQIPNPYNLFLYFADHIMVTADSVRMMSESCSSSRQVQLIVPMNLGFQYEPLVKQLLGVDYARKLGDFNPHQTIKNSTSNI